MLTYELNPWTRVILEKLIVTQMFKKFTAFYGPWRSFTVLTSVRHWALSWDICIQSTITFFFFLFFFSSKIDRLFRSHFPMKILYVFLIYHMRATCPTHLTFFHFIIIINTSLRLGKIKVNVSLCFNWAPCHEGVLWEWMYSSTHSWSRH